ncbi:regulatory protein GemA [Actinobacillus genomosp. 2]|uniref:gp16 family protein n=1 Tax=Actinobacillus genomosp. 2 TaxID=230709 RepID=UPI0024432AAC|nr:regulatory protein GemA [Actinobacillus genomosp. 2]WGE32573.1 regulatory protein GemA [Actinobacillus genomosp. 2]
MQPQTRQQMIQKIHIGKAELKMDRECYTRFLLETVDKHSCSVMTDGELMQVLQAMKAKGFKVKSKQHGKKPDVGNSPTNQIRKRYMDKIEAFLTEMQKPWNYAHAICKKSFGIDRLQWCTEEQLRKIVQMLAVSAKRHGRRVK